MALIRSLKDITHQEARRGEGGALPGPLILRHRSRRQGAPLLTRSARSSTRRVALRPACDGLRCDGLTPDSGNPPDQDRRTTMSNHNLFYHGADGTVEPATSAQILAAAREVLAHRVRRGALLQSPRRRSVSTCRPVSATWTMRFSDSSWSIRGIGSLSASICFAAP